MRHGGVDAEAGQQQEVAVSRAAQIHPPPVTLDHLLEHLDRLLREAYLTRPDVAGAGGDRPERGLAPGQTVRHLADRPVASAGHDQWNTSIGCCARVRDPVAGLMGLLPGGSPTLGL